MTGPRDSLLSLVRMRVQNSLPPPGTTQTDMLEHFVTLVARALTQRNRDALVSLAAYCVVWADEVES